MTEPSPRYARISHRGRPSYAVIDQRGAARLLGGAPWAGGEPTGATLPAGSVGSAEAPLLCPVEPSKIIGIGRNYRKHAEELKNEVPEEPLMFFKPPSSLLAPGGTVVLPKESARVDYEGELVVVIGARCRRISPSEGRRAIFGYSIACDVTARDLQTKDKQWTRAKGFDTFCPIGPHVVPLPDAGALGLQLRVNGKLEQDGKTSDMLFDVPSLIAYASQSMTLEPGDIILTGTPEGVGPLASGDRVVVSIEGLGDLAFGVSDS
jgi:2-keto-4-pentenoate hydratase/2-oxohepta-3-ene-1,7-dioic acid hydratase in catechol pathway